MAQRGETNGIMPTDRSAGESGRRGGGTCDAQAALQELVGPASLWPRLICRLFWTRRLRNADRADLCTFCFVNGVPPSLVLDWIGGCVPIFGDESAQQHFAYVHEALSVGRQSYLYAYNVSQNRHQRLAKGSCSLPAPSAQC